MELDDGCDFEESHAGLGGSVAGGECDDVFEGDAVGVEVEVGLVSEAGDVDYCAEVEMSVELEVIVHLAIQIIMENYYKSI